METDVEESDEVVATVVWLVDWVTLDCEIVLVALVVLIDDVVPVTPVVVATLDVVVPEDILYTASTALFAVAAF